MDLVQASGNYCSNPWLLSPEGSTLGAGVYPSPAWNGRKEDSPAFLFPLPHRQGLGAKKSELPSRFGFCFLGQLWPSLSQPCGTKRPGWGDGEGAGTRGRRVGLGMSGVPGQARGTGSGCAIGAHTQTEIAPLVHGVPKLETGG